jgi:hypothetical protein
MHMRQAREAPPPPAGVSRRAAAFLRRCLLIDPAARPGPAELRADPFLFPAAAAVTPPPPPPSARGAAGGGMRGRARVSGVAGEGEEAVFAGRYRCMCGIYMYCIIYI